MADFFQDGPTLGNEFQKDWALKSLLSFYLPSQYQKEVEKDLHRFSQRVSGEIESYAQAAESHPPQHRPYDPWGRRIDQLIVDSSWKELHKIAAQEGLVSIGYKRNLGEWSRVYQFAKLYLFHAWSAFYGCPLAMADGAAKLLEKNKDPLFQKAFRHLTTENPQEFWTSGQWMTERTGGSDVSGTSTWAEPQGDHYLLSGVKWFSSATTSEMALALARKKGAPEGSKGLSLFYIEVYRKDGTLNGIEILRLKEKLGTKALPTAELKLNQTKAFLIGEENQGVKQIATMLNVTRLYNSICSASHSRRMVSLATDYSRKRKAFGQTLLEQPLHSETLAQLSVQTISSLLLTFQLSSWLGKEETGKISETEKKLLRLFTPIAKLMTAKSAVSVASEGIELFGGAGYIEDTRIPILLRDSQVYPIWEGTTNILSLDILRVMKDGEIVKALSEYFDEEILKLTSDSLSPYLPALRIQFQDCKQNLISFSSQDHQVQQLNSRELAFSLGYLLTKFLFCSWADFSAKNNFKDTGKILFCIERLEREEQKLKPIMKETRRVRNIDFLS